jgi:DNA-binding MarR family transcriptional regulator
MEPRLRELGISWATFQLLTTVANIGPKASQIEVARRLGITAASLSEAVQAHVARGLIEQIPHPKDKRIRILRLTPASQQIVSSIKDLVLKSETAMTKGLSAAEVASASAVLDRVLVNLEESLREPFPEGGPS